MSYLQVIILPIYLCTVYSVLYFDIWKRYISKRNSYNYRNAQFYVYTFLATGWAMAALFRPWGVTPDDLNYSFHLVLTHRFSEAPFENAIGFSHGYYVLLSLVREVWNDENAFLVLSGVFVFGKLWLIGRITNYSVFGLFSYVSIFFLLHDVVQFRAGASAFFLLFAIYLVHRSASKYSILYSVLSFLMSVLLHAQALASPLALLVRQIFKARYWSAVGVVLFTQVLVGVGVDPTNYVLSIIDIEGSTRLFNTVSNSFEGTGVRVTTLVILIALSCLIPGLKVEKKTIANDVSFYMVIGGFLLYWATSSVDVLSNRLMQFMWVPLCLIAPLARHNAKTYLTFFVVCVGYFYLSGWINYLLSVR